MMNPEKYLELVKQDLFSARVEWRLYRSLFGTNEETVDLLNEVSGPTANTLERVLFERTLLNIRKLNEPPNNERRRTKSVSVQGLRKFCFPDDQVLASLVKTSIELAAFARNWSNKRIAHSDFDYRDGHAKLEKASRAKVEAAFGAIAQTLKHVSTTHLDTTLITHPIPPLNDERRMLEVLYLGQRERRNLKSDKKRYLEERNYRALDELRSQDRTRFPSWLHRDNPPLDVD
ncbi:hypothetical protein [Tateyamaria sp. ANG-S1]|uniref:AbiU2 domain-containing protein n=1 Tax=Tateyamaria sp. ANG-S1 TaxID=1577905 RepID=UPI00057ECFC9|nr:hypothetical protein [Tateyamaria sp. ANG-S1]